MKIKEAVNLDDLLKLGFKKLISREELPTYDYKWEEWDFENKPNEYEELELKEKEILKDAYILEEYFENAEYYFNSGEYVYNFGHSRRGQHYYLIVSNKTKIISILSSEPDGSGGRLEMDNIIIELYKLDYIE